MSQRHKLVSKKDIKKTHCFLNLPEDGRGRCGPVHPVHSRPLSGDCRLLAKAKRTRKLYIPTTCGFVVDIWCKNRVGAHLTVCPYFDAFFTLYILYMCVYIYVCMYVCMYVWLYVCMYIYIYMYIFIYTHVYIYLQIMIIISFSLIQRGSRDGFYRGWTGHDVNINYV